MHKARDVFHSLKKDLGCQILGVVMVPCTIVNIVVYLVNVLLVQETEGLGIRLGSFDQGYLVCQIVQNSMTSRAPIGLAQ